MASGLCEPKHGEVTGRVEDRERAGRDDGEEGVLGESLDATAPLHRAVAARSALHVSQNAVEPVTLKYMTHAGSTSWNAL